MHHIVEMYDFITTGWLDCNGALPDLSNFCVSSEAYSAFGRSPADKVRSVWGDMICCTGVHHPARSCGSVKGNGEIFIIVYLLYTSSSDMRVDRLGALHAVSLLLLFLFLCVPFLLAALICLVPKLLAVMTFNFAFICLIALAFNRGDLV